MVTPHDRTDFDEIDADVRRLCSWFQVRQRAAALYKTEL